MKYVRLAVFCIAFAWCSTFALGQSSYPPVYLRIMNIPQETDTWCWAAVAQQIVFALKGQSRPSQCEMVELAYGKPSYFCCNQFGKWNGNHQCRLLGNLKHIQYLISYFGGRQSQLSYPTNPFTLYRTLYYGYPVIMFVKESAYQKVGHFVVIVGMSWTDIGFGIEPILHINDPISLITTNVPFRNIADYWEAAIVVF